MNSDSTDASHSFTASTIATYTEDDLFVIALADDRVQPGHFLVLSRPAGTENSPIYDCIELQSHHCERGVAGVLLSIALTSRDLTVRIKPQHAAYVGAASFTGHFAVDGLEDDTWRRLDHSIRTMLAGSEIEFASERSILS